MYKYTFDEIAGMTPYQKFALFNQASSDDRFVHFDTYDEFLEWQIKSSRN